MCNGVTVCCGRVRLKFLVRVWLDMWKSLERDSAMIFYVTLMCCDHREVLLLTRVQLSHQDTSSCDSAFTGSQYALCIQPSVLELSMNDKMCEPCTSCRMVMQIDIVDARNQNRFSVSFLFHYYGILHCHANTLLMDPPMTYSQASEYSVTVDLKKTMLLIGTPLVDKRWRDLIHSWGYWK